VIEGLRDPGFVGLETVATMYLLGVDAGYSKASVSV